jgi:hypothetical protein
MGDIPLRTPRLAWYSQRLQSFPNGNQGESVCENPLGSILLGGSVFTITLKDSVRSSRIRDRT